MGRCGGTERRESCGRIPVEEAPWLPEKQRKSLLEALDDVTIAGETLKDLSGSPFWKNLRTAERMGHGQRVEQGTLSEGDTVLVMPNRESSRVEELQINDHVVAYAKPGENVRVKLRNLALESVAKGFVLSSIENPIPIVKQFTARINVLQSFGAQAYP